MSSYIARPITEFVGSDEGEDRLYVIERLRGSLWERVGRPSTYPNILAEQAEDLWIDSRRAHPLRVRELDPLIVNGIDRDGIYARFPE